MGRYYSGDIEGKFMFAVQSSDAADRFGVHGEYPPVLEYWYYEDDLEGVVDELERIEHKIGIDNIKALDTFFENAMTYCDETLKAAGLLDIWTTYKEDYADYKLGIKIRDSIIAIGRCEFTAEL